ncbi:hypothetical protein [Gilliamella apicola]|uniref:Uncharacterized protein n=2 Tax=Gilliamella apicola TaxID=1196095 RepID=A0A242NDW6_9GAMM|nr:hypothetical protein [Gilliamella apicola]OTP80907.1 hypothetical protein B5S40_14260 [Gilliamella apicola]OTP86023.1 hypothetical protein B5S44_02950 [Gilliamella apicola]OTP87966.1 hypothetical protein B5S42_09050 [Gilliamella apicola]OTP97903.1 hypothetical protein B6D08_13150 [Gilliamella apicola]OTQ08522.1 hypothetical protein B6C87_11305 [Gilliamella apicola]
MWLFWLYEFLGFVAVISLIVAYCRIRKQRFWSFTWKYLKWILLSIVGVLLVIAILCRHDLYNATHCYFRGVSMHAQTKYSIYLGECQIETPSGSYVPIDRTRALPGSSDHGNNDDVNDFYPTN